MTSPRFSTLEQWLHWQETLHVREIDLGLSRSREVADRLGLGVPPFPVITVAGTNGKGSSVALLSACLRAGGYRVACYTSPHLTRYNERIQIDGVPVDDTAICEAFARIDVARGETPLTYFEFGTLAALDIFYRQRPDVVVLEVGLGGRLDAVNIIDSDCALLTAIDIDHVDWLGPDRESIGREKAGIFRHARPAVCADPRPPASIALEASRIGAKLHQLGIAFEYQESEQGWTWRAHNGHSLELPAMTLVGHFQYQNASGVIQVLQLLQDRLPLSEQALREGIASASLAGRFQKMQWGPIPVILDVAHNPHAAAALAKNLIALPCAGKTRAVFGMLRDKDATGVIEQLKPYVDDWYVVSLGGPRGAPAQVLVEALASSGIRDQVQICEEPSSAMQRAHKACQIGDRLLVFGSFLTVSAAQAVLNPVCVPSD